MGIGGYLASEAEQDQFKYIQRQTRARVARSTTSQLENKVHHILAPIGVQDDTSRAITYDLILRESHTLGNAVTRDQPHLTKSLMRRLLDLITARSGNYRHVGGAEEAALNATLLESSTQGGITDFLVKFGEGHEEVPTSRLYISAFTIGIAYFLGGLIPMVSYYNSCHA